MPPSPCVPPTPQPFHPTPFPPVPPPPGAQRWVLKRPLPRANCACYCWRDSSRWGHSGLRVCQEPRWGHQKRETARSDLVPVPKGHLHKEECSLVVGHQTALGRKKKDFWGETACLVVVTSGEGSSQGVSLDVGESQLRMRQAPQLSVSISCDSRSHIRYHHPYIQPSALRLWGGEARPSLSPETGILLKDQLQKRDVDASVTRFGLWIKL